MSGGIDLVGLPYGATATADDDPDLILVVAPIESETMDATLAEIRGDVPAERNTLAKISAAFDAQAQQSAQTTRRITRRQALIFG